MVLKHLAFEKLLPDNLSLERLKQWDFGENNFVSYGSDKTSNQNVPEKNPSEKLFNSQNELTKSDMYDFHDLEWSLIKMDLKLPTLCSVDDEKTTINKEPVPTDKYNTCVLQQNYFAGLKTIPHTPFFTNSKFFRCKRLLKIMAPSYMPNSTATKDGPSNQTIEAKFASLPLLVDTENNICWNHLINEKQTLTFQGNMAVNMFEETFITFSNLAKNLFAIAYLDEPQFRHNKSSESDWTLSFASTFKKYSSVTRIDQKIKRFNIMIFGNMDPKNYISIHNFLYNLSDYASTLFVGGEINAPVQKTVSKPEIIPVDIVMESNLTDYTKLRQTIQNVVGMASIDETQKIFKINFRKKEMTKSEWYHCFMGISMAMKSSAALLIQRSREYFPENGFLSADFFSTSDMFKLIHFCKWHENEFVESQTIAENFIVLEKLPNKNVVLCYSGKPYIDSVRISDPQTDNIVFVLVTKEELVYEQTTPYCMFLNDNVTPVFFESPTWIISKKNTTTTKLRRQKIDKLNPVARLDVFEKLFPDYPMNFRTYQITVGKEVNKGHINLVRIEITLPHQPKFIQNFMDRNLLLKEGSTPATSTYKNASFRGQKQLFSTVVMWAFVSSDGKGKVNLMNNEFELSKITLDLGLSNPAIDSMLEMMTSNRLFKNEKKNLVG